MFTRAMNGHGWMKDNTILYYRKDPHVHTRYPQIEADLYTEVGESLGFGTQVWGFRACALAPGAVDLGVLGGYLVTVKP